MGILVGIGIMLPTTLVQSSKGGRRAFQETDLGMNRSGREVSQPLYSFIGDGHLVGAIYTTENHLVQWKVGFGKETTDFFN